VNQVKRVARPARKREENLALEIDRHLQAAQRLLRRPLEQEIASGRLTRPQIAVMRAVVEADGISLKDLSREVGLAHSTVSGIVDRLERRGMVRRRAGVKDRRVTQVVVSGEVRAWMRTRLPLLKVNPLVKALARAKRSEITEIVTGMRTLRRVLEQDQSLAFRQDRT
jgi:DNA-binding MarR family transcriptional regulator